MFAVHSAREVAKDGVPLFRAIRDHAKWLQHDEDGDIGTTPLIGPLMTSDDL
jgi:hypothetical protein